MLVGEELLNKARALSNRPEDEIARGCGYVGPSGRLMRKSFYRGLVEAKGLVQVSDEQVKKCTKCSTIFCIIKGVNK